MLVRRISSQNSDRSCCFLLAKTIRILAWNPSDKHKIRLRSEFWLDFLLASKKEQLRSEFRLEILLPSIKQRLRSEFWLEIPLPSIKWPRSELRLEIPSPSMKMNSILLKSFATSQNNDLNANIGLKSLASHQVTTSMRILDLCQPLSKCWPKHLWLQSSWLQSGLVNLAIWNIDKEQQNIILYLFIVLNFFKEKDFTTRLLYRVFFLQKMMWF